MRSAQFAIKRDFKFTFSPLNSQGEIYETGCWNLAPLGFRFRNLADPTHAGSPPQDCRTRLSGSSPPKHFPIAVIALGNSSTMVILRQRPCVAQPNQQMWNLYLPTINLPIVPNEILTTSSSKCSHRKKRNPQSYLIQFNNMKLSSFT
jgi:hypothetical protein